MPRFVDEVSGALAQRIGADERSRRSSDPQVQLVTFLIAGLSECGLESTFHNVQQAASISALNKVVRRDILRAARLAEPTLTAFDNM